MAIRPVKPAAQILADAADLLEQRGWCQHPSLGGDWRTRPRPLCVGLAMQAALVAHGERYAITSVQQEDENTRAWLAVMAEVGVGPESPESPMISRNLIEWNDAPGRVAEEVITALRNAKRHLPAPEAAA